jgi:antitoxin ParD1/3/4
MRGFVSTRTTLNVSLTAELLDYIERQLASGRYRTASELVRAALRMQQDADGQLGAAASSDRAGFAKSKDG